MDLYGRFVVKNIGISGKYSKIGRWEFLGFLTTPLWETKAKAVGYPGRTDDQFVDVVTYYQL